MIRKILPKLLLAALAIVVYSCANDNEDGLAVDCSGSNIALSVVSTTDASCTTLGAVEVSVSGNEGNVNYSLDGTNFDLGSTINELAPGSYTITGKDETGCTATVSVTIAAGENSIEADLTVTNAGCGQTNGSIDVSASGGNGTFEYNIDGGDFGTDASFSGLAPGSYTIGVTDGECETTISAQITTDVSLETDIMPIINDNCAISGCHGNSQSPILDSKSAVIAAATRINARTSAQTMPPASRPDLTQQEIDLISCWVEDGALDN